MTYNQIAQTMKLYVFPTNGQTQQKLKSKWKKIIKKSFPVCIEGKGYTIK